MERNVLCLPEKSDGYLPKPDCFVACYGEAARKEGLRIAQDLRQRGFYAEVEHRSVSMKAQLKRADKLGAKTLLALGDREIAEQSAVVRNMSNREETKTSLTDACATISKLL